MSGDDGRWRAFAVGVGANLGDRDAQVAMAVRLLDAHDVRDLHLGPAIVTDPVVPASAIDRHPAYLNTAIVGATTSSPQVLMARLLAVEACCGRRRRGAVDPRTLDLDLLVFEGAVVRREGLEVPHPRLSGRRFVLEPLLALLRRLETGADDARRRQAATIRAALADAGVVDSGVA